MTQPLSSLEEEPTIGKKKKKNKVNVFDADGKRTSYFADDFKVDLKSMVCIFNDNYSYLLYTFWTYIGSNF